MLHKIDLFHADFNYFIVLRKKTNLCSQFTHVFCTFALEIKNEIYIISSRLFRFLI